MPKPVLILDAHWRSIDELFSKADFAALGARYQIVWAQDTPIPADVLNKSLPNASVLIAATPHVDHVTLTRAPKLKTVIEVSGSFPDTIDYAACRERGVDVLSCAPGFRSSVAEMAVAMALAGARGLVSEHELFRQGKEHWLADNPESDFTLLDANIGFVGFGSIARETLKLLRPFRPKVTAYDPWLPPRLADEAGVTLADLDTVVAHSRCLFVTAVPTAENKGIIDAAAISRMPAAALMVLISRAHLVDFEAVLRAAERGDIRVAIDVFPQEPVAPDHPLRANPNPILSPHRAAAVKDGRQLIGAMILNDLALMAAGKSSGFQLMAAGTKINSLAGVGDADQIQELAQSRT